MKYIKKIIFTLMITMITSMVMASYCFAKTGKVTVDSLNVRETASKTADVIDGLVKNQEVTIEGEEDNFYKIKTSDGVTGYASKDYIEVVSTEEVTTTPTEPEVTATETTTTPVETTTTTTETTSTVTYNKNQVVKSSSDMDIRITPVINALVIGKVQKDQEITVITSAGKWSYIETSTLTGWVVTAKISGETVVNNNTEEQKEEVVENKEEEKQEEQKTETTTETKTMYAKTGSNIRKGPSTDNEVLTTVSTGDELKVVGEEDNWYKLETSQGTGYIRKDLATSEITSRSADVDRNQTSTTIINSSGNAIVDFAKQYLGKPYVYAASGPDSFDCSGFTMFVYNHFGYSLPHTATGQSKHGEYVAKEDLQPGDLVFFTDYSDPSSGIGHVGIYVGDGNFIHASSGSSYAVIISNLNSGSYLNRYNTARRLSL